MAVGPIKGRDEDVRVVTCGRISGEEEAGCYARTTDRGRNRCAVLKTIFLRPIVKRTL